jgi:chorismate synthase
MLRFLTAGESHGKGVLVIIEGVPANVPISLEFIRSEMRKRKKGSGAGGRQMIEKDEVQILAGIRFGKTLGSPISIYIENQDFKNWGEKMSVEDVSRELKEKIKVQNPRPGHADLAGVLKYGFDDVRNVLERASARETTARVTAGAIFKQIISQFGIDFASHTIQIGKIKLSDKKYSFDEVKRSYANDPEIRCIDSVKSNLMKEEIDKTRRNMNTLGGVIEVWAVHVPPGLGSYVHFDTKIDGQIAQALMSIHSVKAVEIGSGVTNASMHGSEVHDEIYFEKSEGYFRKTNRAGGVEGGVTNGMPIVARVYHKPISTLYKPLRTVNIKTKKTYPATVERSDICIVPRAGVISEAMLAYVIAKNFLEKFGSDNLQDIKASYSHYLKRLKI